MFTLLWICSYFIALVCTQWCFKNRFLNHFDQIRLFNSQSSHYIHFNRLQYISTNITIDIMIAFQSFVLSFCIKLFWNQKKKKKNFTVCTERLFDIITNLCMNFKSVSDLQANVMPLTMDILIYICCNGIYVVTLDGNKCM